MQYLVSFLVLLRYREKWLLYLYCLLDVTWLLMFLPLPHDAVVGSAVCECGISWSYSLACSIYEL